MLRNLCWVVAAALVVARPAWADEPAADAKPAIADLVRQLDAESFTERQAASAELAARGREAIPALIEAARGESAEAATRSVDVLRKHWEGSDDALKTAAKEALEKLATGDGATARRATEILKPKPMTPVNPRGVPLAPGIRAVPGGGAFRIAVAAGGIGGGKRITMKEADGVKEIDVVEGDRTTRIEETPGKSIKIKVTDKKDGKAETKEYEAKTVEELKEKHPEGHKIYEQYGKGGGEIRVEGLRFGIAPGAPGVPGFAPAPIALPRERPIIIRDPKELTDRLDKAQQQLDDVRTKLKKLAETADDADELRKAVDAIEATKKELDEVKAKFPAR
jgi:hypothetical protein